jgi:hypothetical protein
VADASDDDLGAAEVHLSLSGWVEQRQEDLSLGLPVDADRGADDAGAARVAVLVAQAFIDASCGVTLLGRCVAVIVKDLLEDGQEGTENGLGSGLGGVEGRRFRRQPPRPDKVKIKGAVEQRLIELACRDPPQGRCHWTPQLLADELVVLGLVDRLGIETVRQALKKTRLANLGRTCRRIEIGMYKRRVSPGTHTLPAPPYEGQNPYPCRYLPDIVRRNNHVVMKVWMGDISDI